MATVPRPANTAYLAWSESMTRYNFGPAHPMNPVRLALTMRLAEELGVLEAPGVRIAAPVAADDDLLASVHSRAFIEAVRAVDRDPSRMEHEFGLGTDDVPCFPGMHQVSAEIVGGTVAAAESVWSGAATHGVSIAGGLHHAMPGRAGGFCVYNDIAVGIRALLDAGAERIAYVDTDVHHGDGVQAAFFDDPRVLTISLHESPRTLFPGTGFAHETGGADAPGSAVNVALPPGTGDAGWLRAFHAVVPPLLRAYKPQMLVTQHGCDSHVEDPLAHLALSVDGQRAAMLASHELATELCAGRWLSTGGGGYALVDVVPRAWTHLIAIAAGAEIDPATLVPTSWRQYASSLGLGLPPVRMSDGCAATFRAVEDGYDPADRLDQAVLATRNAVFPFHGLDPAF